MVKNFAQIPRGDYLEGFNFAVVDGREIFGPPLEAYAARREVAWLREGIRKAGRPGMAIAYYPINTRAATMIAPLDPVSGLRRTDGVILSPLPDIKVETDLLTAAIVYEDYGCFRINHGALALVGTQINILPLLIYSKISETGSDFPAAAALSILLLALCSCVMAAGEWVAAQRGAA